MDPDLQQLFARFEAEIRGNEEKGSLEKAVFDLRDAILELREEIGRLKRQTRELSGGSDADIA